MQLIATTHSKPEPGKSSVAAHALQSRLTLPCAKRREKTPGVPSTSAHGPAGETSYWYNKRTGKTRWRPCVRVEKEKQRRRSNLA